MTRRQAGVFFFTVTGVFLLVFVALTIHSHFRFPALTHADRITAEVLAGKDVWHRNNCVNCHTLMGEGAHYAPDLTEITQHRGQAYLASFLENPGRFYSAEQHGRVMPVPNLTTAEINSVIAFLDWIARIEKYDWPPRPILVAGSAMPGAFGTQAPEAASDDPVALGEALFRASPPACFTCHSTAPGVVLAGPSLAGIGARAEATIAAAGYTGNASTGEDYIRESITMPHAYITEGPAFFSVNGRSVMPDNFEQTLTPEQIEQLVAYLMTLR